MAADSIVESDPFADHVDASHDTDIVDVTTLQVGRSASLTLATDSLVVVDEAFRQRKTRNCCGLIPNETKTTQAIPFFNVLWAEVSDFDITVQYAKAVSKTELRVIALRYYVEKTQLTYAKSWTSKLLDRAYGDAQRMKRIKVLINPYGGTGGAQRFFLRDVKPIFAAACCKVDVEKTSYRGHAVEIAEKLDINHFDVIASCSGDGLPHEVFNGLGKRKDAGAALSSIAVVQLPCGSGNAMSWNLNGTDSNSMAALCVVKGIRMALDLVSITQGDRRTLSFLSQAVGIVADVDLGTDSIRWMGSARFTYGFFVRILKKTIYPCELAVKIDIPDKSQIRNHVRQAVHEPPQIDDRGRKYPVSNSSEHASTTTDGGLPLLKYGDMRSPLPASFTNIPGDKLGNFYAGNMALMAPNANFFPAALPSDGYLDVLTMNGDVGMVASTKSFLAVESSAFFDMPVVDYKKASAYRILPKKQEGKEGYISIDGESYPFEGFQAEVHRGLGTVLSRTGKLYEADRVVPKTRII